MRIFGVILAAVLASGPDCLVLSFSPQFLSTGSPRCSHYCAGHGRSSQGPGWHGRRQAGGLLVASMQMGGGRGQWEDPEDARAALPRSLPSLGRLEICTAEPNVPVPPKASRWGRLLAFLGLRRPGRGARRRGVTRPAAGVGATVGFMTGGPLGALIGAVAGAFASTREGATGEATRTAAKAAGVYALVLRAASQTSPSQTAMAAAKMSCIQILPLPDQPLSLRVACG